MLMVLLAVSCAPARAQDAAASEEDAELAALLAVIEEETDLATRTRMNADFVPGIVSVLEGEQLAALGVRTVWEAMTWIPGVEAARDLRGTPTVTVRGVHFPFNNGNIRILLDGVPMSRESAGVNSAALLFPIEQVERLEFVRGPGSVIYGEFAFQGLLNIVPRRDGTRLAVELDDDGGRAAHAAFSAERAGWTLAGNLSDYANDELSAPSSQPAHERRRFATVALQGQGVSLAVQGQRRRQDDLDPRRPDLRYDDRSNALELRWRHAFAAGVELGTRLQWQENRLDLDIIDFDGAQWTAGAELQWRATPGQQWLFGVEHSDGRIDRATFRPVGLPGTSPLPPVQLGARERQVSGVLVQNQIALAEGLQLTLGARYDDNSEVGKRLTPRGALAWQLAEHHVLKAQYAQGYRSPTFFELYANPVVPELDFEVNTTRELSYVFRREGATGRLTLFHSDIEDMVFPDIVNRRFGNFSRARSHGVELEWSQQFGRRWRLDANLAHNDSRDDRNPAFDYRPIGATADWLGQLAVLWRPRDDITVGLRWHHAEGRDSAPSGRDAYQRLDLSLTRHNLGGSGVDLQFVLHNPGQRRVVYLDPLPNADIPFQLDETSAWLRLRWSPRG
jgi:outer membrane receptor for ferrienterochelin and colicins